MEYKVETESHTLGIIEFDNFIKVKVYLPMNLYCEITVESQNYPNRFEYERNEISKFRNEIFNREAKGVFLFSNEIEYNSFLLKNELQFDSTGDWFKVVFIEVGLDWFLKTKAEVISEIKRRSSDFQYRYTIRRQIGFCKDLVKADEDLQICPHKPNSVRYLDWAIDVVDIDDFYYYFDLRYTYQDRNMIATSTFYKTYMDYLKNYELTIKNRYSVISIPKNIINEAIIDIKNVIRIDLSNLKIGEAAYWKARSFEE